MSVEPFEMELQQNAVVRTQDGTAVGTIDRFVVHPARRCITHLVISKGRFLTTERVVPLDLIATATADEVLLVGGLDPNDLVPFEIEHYVDLDAASPEADYPGAVDAPVVWSHPGEGHPEPVEATVQPKYPMGYQRVVERSVRTDSRIVAPGIPMCSSDGEALGKVVSVAARPDGQVASVTVDPGWFRSERAIGEQFIDSISADRIVLAVTAETIRQLDESH